MSIAYLHPQPIYSYQHALWQQIVHMITYGGCTYRGGGDGASPGGSFNNWTSGAALSLYTVFSAAQPWTAVAGGFGNANAWIRLLLADGIHEVIYQSGYNTGTPNQYRLRVKCGAPSAVFAGGIPSAIRVPAMVTAADETTLTGSGSDVAPTYVFQSNTAIDIRTCRLIGAAYGNDAPSPYGFWYAAIQAGGAYPVALNYFDPVTLASTSDTDPAVFSFSIGGAASFGGMVGQIGLNDLNGGQDSSLARYGTGAYIQVPLCYPCVYPGAATSIVGLCAGNAINGKIPTYPAPYTRHSTQVTPYGDKGISTLWQWKGAAIGSGIPCSTTTWGDSITIGDLVTKWDGSLV